MLNVFGYPIVSEQTNSINTAALIFCTKTIPLVYITSRSLIKSSLSWSGLANPPPGMFLGCGRKPENPEERESRVYGYKSMDGTMAQWVAWPPRSSRVTQIGGYCLRVVPMSVWVSSRLSSSFLPLLKIMSVGVLAMLKCTR